MPSIDYRALRSAVTIGQALDLLGFVPVERNGDQVRGPCPIHGPTSQQSRSFSANLARNAFQCFTCGAKGSQLDLWSQAKSIPLHEAAIDLCGRLTLKAPTLPKATHPESEKRNP